MGSGGLGYRGFGWGLTVWVAGDLVGDWRSGLQGIWLGGLASAQISGSRRLLTRIEVGNVKSVRKKSGSPP